MVQSNHASFKSQKIINRLVVEIFNVWVSVRYAPIPLEMIEL